MIIVLCMLSPWLYAQNLPLIIDHETAKLEPITAEAIQKAKDVLHIAYTSTSHGR